MLEDALEDESLNPCAWLASDEFIKNSKVKVAKTNPMSIVFKSPDEAAQQPVPMETDSSAPIDPSCTSRVVSFDGLSQLDWSKFLKLYRSIQTSLCGTYARNLVADLISTVKPSASSGQKEVAQAMSYQSLIVALSRNSTSAFFSCRNGCAKTQSTEEPHSLIASRSFFAPVLFMVELLSDRYLFLSCMWVGCGNSDSRL